MSPSGSQTLGSPGGRSSLTTGLVTTGDGAEATAGPSGPGGKAVTVPELGSFSASRGPSVAQSAVPMAHSGSGQLPPACSGNCQHRAQSPHLPHREPSDNIIPLLAPVFGKASYPSPFASSPSIWGEPGAPLPGRGASSSGLGTRLAPGALRQTASDLQAVPSPVTVRWGLLSLLCH